MAFTQEEEDYLRAQIQKQKSNDQLNDLIKKKNDAIVALNESNDIALKQVIADANVALEKTIADTNIANDIAVKTLAKTYDDQIAVINSESIILK